MYQTHENIQYKTHHYFSMSCEMRNCARSSGYYTTILCFLQNLPSLGSYRSCMLAIRIFLSPQQDLLYMVSPSSLRMHSTVQTMLLFSEQREAQRSSFSCSRASRVWAAAAVGSHRARMLRPVGGGSSSERLRDRGGSPRRPM